MGGKTVINLILQHENPCINTTLKWYYPYEIDRINAANYADR